MAKQILLVAFFLFITLQNVIGQAPDKSDCNGLYKGQKKPDQESIRQMLLNHSKWLEKFKNDTYTDSARNDKLRANFCDANLSQVDLSNDSLGRANFDYATLDSARLMKISLWNANLSYARITNAHIWLANLKGAGGIVVDLSNSSFLYSNLENLQLYQGIVIKANFTEANLSNSSLFESNFTGSNLTNTNLKGALMGGVDFKDVIYEVRENCFPQIELLSNARNMHLMTFEKSPKALIQLRDEFAKAGMLQNERELTYAIKHSQRIKMSFFERTFEYLLFESTCGYGLYPWRPLRLLLLNIPLFSILYFFGLSSPKMKVGLWKVWPDDKLVDKSKQNKPSKITRIKWYKVILYGVYFSILSAFNIGFRDFNIGEWITRLQPEDYKLKANGWVRIVSGTQSIISIFFLALWALTYFGKPFN